MAPYTLLLRTLGWAIFTLCSNAAFASDDDKAHDKNNKPPKAASTEVLHQPYGYIAPVALSSPNLALGNASVFQPWFDVSTFAGDIRAYRINGAGRLASTSHWRALDVMNQLAVANPQFWNNTRLIFTNNGAGKGVPFRFSRLSAAQREQVRSEDVVNYIRGKRDLAQRASTTCTDNDKANSKSDDSTRNDNNGDSRGGKSTDNFTKTLSYPPSAQPSLLIKVASQHWVASKSSAEKNDDGNDNGHDDDKNPKSKECPPTTQQLNGPLIGAIIHSRPVYVGPPREGLPFDAYLADFALRLANRLPIVYVGANDGLLHAFNANTGAELFAYVPSTVMGKLPLHTNLSPPPQAAATTTTNSRQATISDELAPSLMRVTSKSSTDKVDGKDKNPQFPAPSKPSLVYTNDGFVTTQDIQINKQWKTILVGGLGAGGQGIYALDVTDPGATVTSEESASDLLLWEFSDRDDSSLGYTYGRPSVIRLRDNASTWAVVVSNGYFSEQADGRAGSGDAALLILNAATGQLMRKLTVNSTVNNQPNGLSSPTVVDSNNDYRADLIYAGDLHGNVWKFDIRSGDPNRWHVANEGAPLYIARDEAGQFQSITAAPAAGFHPINGFLITVGTGRVLASTDLNNNQIQSVYGLWDDPERPTAITQLSNLALTSRADLRTLPSLEIDWETQQGWKLNLPAGERALTEAVIRNRRVQFTSTEPKTGENFFTQVDLDTGSAPTEPFWDLNNDGLLNDADLINAKVPVTKVQGAGLVSRPAFGMTTPGRDAYYINRLVTASKPCIEEKKGKKKSKDDKDDEDSDDSKSSRALHRNFTNFAEWRSTVATPRSFLLKVSGKSGDREEENNDEEDDDHTPPPDECVAPPEPDEDDDRGGTCGRDFDKDKDPDVNNPPVIEITSTGSINNGKQKGNNGTGRKIWREIINTTQ